MTVVLDTHAVLWYLLNSKELSPRALGIIEDATRLGQDVYVSAISLVETIYLVERGRLPIEALKRLETALKDPMSGLVLASLDASVAEAVAQIARDTVPDMPDRIIAATALHLNATLVTRDRRLQSSSIKTLW